MDKFYTKPEIVSQCLEIIKDTIDIKWRDVIVEPSAGDGSFSFALQEYYPNVYAYDIEPDSDYIVKQDFLLLKTNYAGTVHIIGNPPFGRQSGLARKFVKKSCQFANTISFILPKSFKKISMQKCFAQPFHLVKEIDLPEKSFLYEGKEKNVPCVLQIWIKKDHNRTEEKLVLPTYYEYVKPGDEPDISIRRVGVNAGFVSKDVSKSEQSHYFIRLLGIDVSAFLEEYKKCLFDSDNTVGPRSISKQELNKELNKLF